MNVSVTAAAGGALLPVQAQPGARRNAITGVHAGRLKVAVTAPPDKGKANAALIEVLAEALSVRRAQIELRSGATSRSKTFFIAGVDAATLAQRIAVLLRPISD